MAIWIILWILGTFYDHLVHFVFIWYIHLFQFWYHTPRKIWQPWYGIPLRQNFAHFFICPCKNHSLPTFQLRTRENEQVLQRFRICFGVLR
jgi:hypothetical protein